MNNALYYWDAFLTGIVRSLIFALTRMRQSVGRLQTPTVLEQSLFCKRLAMMLRSGLPIGTSLRLLAEEGKTARAQTELENVVILVESGVSLARALELSPYTMKIFARNLVAIGESSGTLPENLEYVAAELKQAHELRKQIIQALIYPAIIIMATAAIAVFLIVVIFPKILPIFESLGSSLPLSTRVLLWLSHVLLVYGVYIALVLIALAPALFFLRRVPAVDIWMGRVALRLPVVGRLSRSYCLATSCRTFAILLRSDVRIIEALSIVTSCTEQTTYRLAWSDITKRVETGQLVSAEMKRYPGLFPGVVVQMVKAGEATGNLSESLRYLAEMYESDVRDITKNLTALLEPILMLVMGLVVGFIAVSIIMPIYGITQQLHP